MMTMRTMMTKTMMEWMMMTTKMKTMMMKMRRKSSKLGSANQRRRTKARAHRSLKAQKQVTHEVKITRILA